VPGISSPTRSAGWRVPRDLISAKFSISQSALQESFLSFQRALLERRKQGALLQAVTQFRTSSCHSYPEDIYQSYQRRKLPDHPYTGCTILLVSLSRFCQIAGSVFENCQPHSHRHLLVPNLHPRAETMATARAMVSAAVCLCTSVSLHSVCRLLPCKERELRPCLPPGVGKLPLLRQDQREQEPGLPRRG